MPQPYVAERQTAQWTSEAIRDSFRSVGFTVREWPSTQLLEKELPADSIFFSPAFSKVFGLQYKTIYRNGGDFWPLDKSQHGTMQGHPWIFYCCSELRDAADHGMALHLSRFYRSRFPFQPRLPSTGLFRGGRGYQRWGAFYRGLKACRIGVRVRSQQQLRDLLGPVTGMARGRETEQLVEVLLADFEQRILFADRRF